MSVSLEIIDAIQNDRLQEVDSLLTKAFEKDTDDDLYLLADTLFQLGFLEETKNVLSKLLENNPQDDEIKINLAEIEIENDNDLQAFEWLNKISKDSESYPQALLVFADYYQVQGLPEVSEQKLLEARDLLPDEPVIEFALAELYTVMGRSLQAIRIYEKLYENHHVEISGVQIPSRLGLNYSSLGDFENASAYFEEAVEQKENADTLFQLGLTYYQVEEYTKAIESFNQVKTLDSTYTSVYPYLALSLNEELRTDEATEAIEEGIRLDETNPHLYMIAANIEIKAEHYDEAKVYFEKALKLDPDNPTIILEYTNFLIYADRDEEAIDLIQEALQDNDADPQFYWNLATAHDHIEEYDLARNSYSKAYEFFDDNPDFLKQYAYFLQEEGQKEKLKEVVQKYLTFEPDDIELVDLLRRLEEE